MGATKAIAAVVVVGAAIGSIYLYSSGGGTSSAALARQAGIELQDTRASLQTAEDWEVWVRGYRRGSSDNPGLVALAEALAAFNAETLFDQRDAFREILDQGWTRNHPEIANALQAQSSAIQRAVDASQAEDIDFPTSDRVDVPVPNFLRFQILLKLMCADARRLEAAGDIQAAAERAIQCARLSEHMIEDNVTLIQNLVGIATLNISFRTLEAILANPGLDDQTARAALPQIERLMRVRTPASGICAAEGRMLPRIVRAVLDGEISPEDSQITAGQVQEMIGGDYDAFTAAYDRLWADISANMDRRSWERERMDDAWVSERLGSINVSALMPNYVEAITRWEVSWAHWNLCWSLVAMRDGLVMEGGAVAQDPFDAHPIRTADDRLWSVGPDMQDQQGQIVYDPTNGAISGGDIIVSR